jgi:hypothetical protein
MGQTPDWGMQENLGVLIHSEIGEIRMYIKFTNPDRLFSKRSLKCTMDSPFLKYNLSGDVNASACYRKSPEKRPWKMGTL